MTAFSKLAAGTVVALSMAALPAFANTLVQTQNDFTPLTQTIFSDTYTFDFYNPANFGGAPLTRVEIDFGGEATTTLTFDAVTDSEVFGTAGASETATFFAGALVLNVLPTAPFGTPAMPLEIPAGTSLTVGPLLGADAEFFFSEAGAVLAQFTGAGTFDVDIEGLGFANINIVGGNFTTDQVTEALAEMEIRYYNMPAQVPTPLTLALFGAGLVGIAALRRKA